MNEAFSIRLAEMSELNAVERLYNELHDAKEAGLIPTIWKRGVYPSRATALAALERNDLFVMEKNGELIGSAVINQIQDGVYAGAPWKHDVPDSRVCVLHTLVISPAASGRGLGTAFVRYYEQFALSRGWRELRLDTNARNNAARSLYRKLGWLAGAAVFILLC